MKMKMNLSKRILNVLVCCLLVQFTAEAGSYTSASQSGQQSQSPAAQQPLQELQQLVAPIALYPDALVAQILAASTYPTQIVEAERWMQSHSNLKGEELAKEVDKQDWDPSVKAMRQFPSVLENMDKNLSWTSSLGEAYVSQPDDVTNAVQTLRREAQKAGHLNSNEQEKVTTQGSTIIIEPANPEVVYIPAYDPWLVYGEPIIAYPAGFPCPGFIGVAPAIPLALDLVSASSEDLGGAGITGDTTGMAVDHSSTTTNGSPTAGILVTTGSIMVTSATATVISATAASITAADSTALRLLTFSQEHAPVRSVALITAGTSEAFPPAGGRALEVEASTEATVAADGTR